jgi:hypothetical protein
VSWSGHGKGSAGGTGDLKESSATYVPSQHGGPLFRRFIGDQ